ncbi:unannotated protein [freshwater metagenome]|uniref:Unannotated protein n=1 Tax=freshwater metagenome TaxID=449393 RepID=A0A6J6CWA2_9ZZZZ
MWFEMQIIGPLFGMFSAPRQSRLAIAKRIGRMIDAPNRNHGVMPNGLPVGGGYTISLTSPPY